MHENSVEYIVAKCLELNGDEIEENSTLIELGMDSLNFIELMVNIEEEFNITIEDEDLLIENFDTIAKIKEYLDNRR